MLSSIQRRVRKGYFQDKERLSWAPFPSYALLAVVEDQSKGPVDMLLERICRYFGGESVSLLSSVKDGLSPSLADFCERGYYYGALSPQHEWYSTIREQGRLVVELPSDASQESLESAYQLLGRKNVFILSEKSCQEFPFRVLSDLLLFITNHEAPVIIGDFLEELFPMADKKAAVEELDCRTFSGVLDFSQAVGEGKVIGQDHKFYRTN